MNRLPDERLQSLVIHLNQVKAIVCFLYLSIPFLHCVKLAGKPRTGWQLFATWRDDWDLSLFGWIIHGPKWTLTAISYIALVGVFALSTIRSYTRACFDDSPISPLRSFRWILAQWTAFIVLSGLGCFVVYVGGLFKPVSSYFGIILWLLNHAWMAFLLAAEAKLYMRVNRST